MPKVVLVNPSLSTAGYSFITPRWLYVLAQATPVELVGDPVIVDESIERFDPDILSPGDIVGIGISSGNCIPGYRVLREAKLKGAFTDPQKLRLGDPGRPEICNVFTMHRALQDEATLGEIDRTCRSGELSCGECKLRLRDVMLRELAPVQDDVVADRLAFCIIGFQRCVDVIMVA